MSTQDDTIRTLTDENRLLRRLVGAMEERERMLGVALPKSVASTAEATNFSAADDGCRLAESIAAIANSRYSADGDAGSANYSTEGGGDLAQNIADRANRMSGRISQSDSKESNSDALADHSEKADATYSEAVPPRGITVQEWTDFQTLFPGLVSVLNADHQMSTNPPDFGEMRKHGDIGKVFGYITKGR